MVSAWLSGVVGEVDELVGEIAVEIVDHAVGLTRLSIHVDDEVGTHCWPEDYPTTFGRKRLTRLAVIGDDDRLVALEPKPHDPREGCIDEAQPNPLLGLHGHRLGNSTIDRYGIAYATRHSRFHAVSKTRSDAPKLL